MPSFVDPAPDLPPPPRGRRGWPWTTPPAPVAPPSAEPAEWPTITVVTPSYNQGRFIEATLRSVLLQGYPRLEYLVLDGGSTDGAVAVIERYARWLTGWTSERDGGQSDAVNKGFARATGEIVAWLNSDDRYLPGTLHAVARAAMAHRDAAAWVGACRSVDVRGRLRYVIEPRGLALPALADWMGAAWFGQPASFYSREKAHRAGPLDTSLHSSFDVDFFLRLAREGRFVAAPESWAEETVHAAAKTSAHPGRSFAELRLVQIRHGYAQAALAHMTREYDELFDRRRETLGRDVLRRAREIASHHLRRARRGPPRHA